MDTLGEDLMLLAIQPDQGTIAARQRLPYGLRGSELVRLAAGGRAFGFVPVVRWKITDAALAAEVRARLDVIVHATGPVDTAQAAMAAAAQAAAAAAAQAGADAATLAATDAAVSAAVHHAASASGSHGGHAGGGGGHH